MEQYPGQHSDEARRLIGEGILAHLVEKGVIDPPPEPAEEPTEPSFREQLEEMKREREQSLASLVMVGMAASLQPEQDTSSEPSFGPAAADRERERERDGQGGFR